ncbi:hypothetical protein QQ213_004418 [Vibrio vulnificus]|uniref:Uncharacterized protein n=1 Tax=Vibrio vulnificus TaxID=672 RepID=A0A8H9THZ8_VIBVL|nr:MULTISPECIES: hypothetical protein [Vibrio]ASM97492.1 hypothetical protein AOT11_20510 [Vibrio vulnificus NBRC 15645 = ATCC 27562]EGQ7955977.1 hypothetical protein [Vibrio vulnificus]EGQ9237903.1 hypothetical protein [Vibrio vulnificus]EGR0395069.1 hypothetical protein [Vibrio vulnificus]EGR7962025.1 hypothetical protein [Vibrio vulnificus]
MIKVVFGVILGFAATIWYVALDLRFDFDSSLSVNIVIAIATAIAAAIHFDSVKSQERERVWELNKAELLNLSKELSEVIHETKQAIDYEYSSSDPEHQTKAPSNPKAYKVLDERLFVLINVQKPLLPKKFMQCVESLHALDKEITRQVFEEDLDNISAHEDMLSKYIELHQELNVFIRKMAGIKNT